MTLQTDRSYSRVVPTVDAGTAPFEILSLLGRDLHDPDALPGRWTEVLVPSGAPQGAQRLVYHATGQEDGVAVPVEILVHVLDSRVQAVALSTPAHVAELQQPTERSRPYLAAIRRPANAPPRLVHWVGLDADGHPVNLGMAY